MSNAIPRCLAALGVCITIAGCCAGDFRFTDLGPHIQTGTVGYPFIYEIGVALVCVGSAATLICSGEHLKFEAFSRILGVLAFYVPIFTNALLDTPNVREQFIGRGPLRLELEAMFFGISLLLVPPGPKVLRWALGGIALGAVLNAVANLLYVTGLAVPLWPPVMRGMTARYSGLFEHTAEVGLISAVGIVAICAVTKHRFWRIVTIGICIVSAGIAQSRTGIIAIAFGLSAMWLYSRKFSVTDRIVAIWLLLFATITISTLILSDPAATKGILEAEAGRMSGILTVIQNFRWHPMGIGWGLFQDLQSTSNYAGGVSPHNWPVIALLHGGIISFSVAMGVHLSLIRSWVTGASRQDYKESRKLPLALMITCVVCSWFEQAFQLPITLFTFFLALAAFSAPPSTRTALANMGQVIRPSLLRFPRLSGSGSCPTFQGKVRARRMGFPATKP